MERLTGLDASFLYFETPTMHMHVCATIIFDPSTVEGGYSFERVREVIESRLHLVAPFRRKLAAVPLNLHHPVWVEDENFDLDFHLHRIGLPSPGTMEQLGEITGDIASRQLDRGRPLWEMWIVEGLDNGNIALVAKMHHCTIDGVSGANMMVHLFDLDPNEVKSDAARVAAGEVTQRSRVSRLRAHLPAAAPPQHLQSRSRHVAVGRQLHFRPARPRGPRDGSAVHRPAHVVQQRDHRAPPGGLHAGAARGHQEGEERVRHDGERRRPRRHVRRAAPLPREA